MSRISHASGVKMRMQSCYGETALNHKLCTCKGGLHRGPDALWHGKSPARLREDCRVQTPDGQKGAEGEVPQDQAYSLFDIMQHSFPASKLRSGVC